MALKIYQWLSIHGEPLQELRINGILDTVAEDGVGRAIITFPSLRSLEALTLDVPSKAMTFYPFRSDQFPTLYKLNLSCFPESFPLLSSCVLPTVKELAINILTSEENLPWELIFPNLEVLDLDDGGRIDSTLVAFKFTTLKELRFDGHKPHEDKWNLLTNSYEVLGSIKQHDFYDGLFQNTLQFDRGPVWPHGNGNSLGDLKRKSV